jgi:two-component system sensor histidine kinase FlrB
MLSFVKGQAGTREIMPLSGLLAELAQIMEPQMLERGVVLLVEDLCPACVLRADRKALTGALLNLLENALQACDSGGRVMLRTRLLETGMLQLSVSDTGRGFDVAVGGRLFEPFFTTRSEGTGLGLAIVRNVAEAHGGGVEARSALGEGSEFMLRLPLEDI